MWLPSMRVDLLAGLAVLFMLDMAGAASPILPPYGFELGDSSRSFKQVLSEQDLTLAGTGTKGNRTVWTVTGFKEENLSRGLLYFDSRQRLDEVELQYENIGWSEKAFTAYLDFFRKNLEAKHGPSLVIQRTNGVEGSARVILDCLHWQQKNVRLRLIRFSASALAKKVKAHYGNVSLHYKRVR
jgi:hypothetical protein